jgi:hypothetical protein
MVFVLFRLMRDVGFGQISRSTVAVDLDPIIGIAQKPGDAAIANRAS